MKKLISLFTLSPEAQKPKTHPLPKPTILDTLTQLMDKESEPHLKAQYLEAITKLKNHKTCRKTYPR